MTIQPDAASWRTHVTIRTIAARAGVHASTVSRTLRQGNLATSERARQIRAIAHELGYRPNQGAATLRSRQSRTLGVLVPRITDFVMAALYEAVDESAISSGYQTLVAGTGDVLENQIKRADMMLMRGVDGLLIADAHPDGKYISWVEETGVPFLLVIRQAGDRVSVTGDDYLGGTLAGTHIADLGHQNVAILAGLDWSSANMDRTRGCLDALRARGIMVPDQMVQTCALDPHSGRAAMENLLSRNRSITAVFAVDDFTAIGASLALREKGLRVGSEVGLVGYNDVQIAAAFDLTTVRVPLRSIGSIAARLLLDVMANRRVESVRLAPELIVRGSSHRTIR